jgi:putative sugar O-methyltransferase
MGQSVIGPILEGIERSYRLAKSITDSRNYSVCWDMNFYSEFANHIGDEDLWSKFLAVGFAHGLGGLDFKRFDQVVPNLRVTDPEEIDLLAHAYEDLCQITGREFVDSLLESEIGYPRHVVHAGRKLNFNDLRNIYAAFVIREHIHHTEDRRPVLVEIGAGYGLLASKLKRLFPTSKIILIDLPEDGAMQFYYLRQVFPEAQILGYADFAAQSLYPLSSLDFDFLCVPPSVLEEFPDDFMDAVVNARSMQEMVPAVIDHYFGLIHRKTRVGGVFYCVNRYYKSEVGVPIRFKDLPYDNRWEIAVSPPSWSQPRIHELMTRRTAASTSISVSETLVHLPPYRLRDCFGRRGVAKLMVIVNWASWPGMGNPGFRRMLLGLGEHPRDPLRALRNALGRMLRRIGVKRS